MVQGILWTKCPQRLLRAVGEEQEEKRCWMCVLVSSYSFFEKSAYEVNLLLTGVQSRPVGERQRRGRQGQRRGKGE